MYSRTAARRLTLSFRTAARQSVPRHVGVRYNASRAGESPPTSASAFQQMSPFVAAAIGGGVVLAGDTACDKTLPPNAIIQFLRNPAKSYVWFIPGASAYVDASFDAVDRLEQTHREEVEAIVKRTYEEFLEVTKNGQADAQTAQKVFDVLKRQSAELAELAKKAAKHPEVTENLGGASRWVSSQSAKDTAVDKTLPPNAIIQLLRSTAKSYVWFIPGASAYVDASFDAVDRLEQTHREEVEAIVKRTYDEFLEVAKNGQADAQTAQKVFDLLNRQSAELAEVAKKAAEHPEVTENLGGASRWISSLSTIATSKSEDAKKLLDATYSDVLSVLKEKSEKAKKLAEDAKEDLEKGSSKNGQGKGEEKEDEKKNEQKAEEKETEARL